MRFAYINEAKLYQLVTNFRMRTAYEAFPTLAPQVFGTHTSLKAYFVICVRCRIRLRPVLVPGFSALSRGVTGAVGLGYAAIGCA